jgi:hypothetical protein
MWYWYSINGMELERPIRSRVKVRKRRRRDGIL